MHNAFESELQAIPWQSLKTANGVALEVPGAIRGLLSSDATVRDKAYWNLDNVVVRQADLYEAAYYVIPFVAAIAADRSQRGRVLALKLLFELANGYAADPTCTISVSGRMIPLRDAVRAALGSYRSIFLQAMDDSDAEVRKEGEDILERLDDEL